MAARSSAASLGEWYSSLGKWLLRQLHFIPQNQRLNLPIDSASWEEFLAEIADRAVAAGQRIVIVLDEIGAVPSAWATDFFSIIRSIYTSRQNFPLWQYITFIIAGAFNPKELIKDTTISNFNVDQRISLADFSLSQVNELVKHLCLPEEITEAVSARVHYWTDGQPYLTQRLCLLLAHQEELIQPSAVERLVDKAVRRFLNEDTHYLERIRNLSTEPELLAYMHSITSHHCTRLSAGLNNKHFRLAHIIGVIKADADGFCQLRNHICEQALAEIDVVSIPKPTHAGANMGLGRRYSQQNSAALEPMKSIEVFFSYAHADEMLRQKLEAHLSTLKRHGYITDWHDRNISAGQEWVSIIDEHLKNAQVILLLVSSDFIASDYCYSIEMTRALERHSTGDACVIPIILRPVNWKSAPFGNLQALPTGGKAVTSWTNEDEALLDTAIGIQNAVENLIASLEKIDTSYHHSNNREASTS